jgi:ferredoxin
VQQNDAPPTAGPLTPETLELERARENPTEMLSSAAKIRRQFKVGSAIFGGWVGLVIGFKLAALALRRRRTDYEPAAGDCVACARCFEFCPNELVRRGMSPAMALASAAAIAKRAPVSEAILETKQ